MAQERAVSRTAVILFPIVITLLVSLAVPPAAPLIGMLMFGNLLKESGVTDRLSKTASARSSTSSRSCSAWSIGATMSGVTFLRPQTLFIIVLGAVAFSFSTAGGILLAKLLNLILPGRAAHQPVHRGGRRLGRADVGAGGAEVRLRADPGPRQPAHGGDGPERGRRDRLGRGGRGVPGDPALRTRGSVLSSLRGKRMLGWRRREM
jgi:hypothetical protein